MSIRIDSESPSISITVFIGQLTKTEGVTRAGFYGVVVRRRPIGLSRDYKRLVGRNRGSPVAIGADGLSVMRARNFSRNHTFLYSVFLNSVIECRMDWMMQESRKNYQDKV